MTKRSWFNKICYPKTDAFTSNPSKAIGEFSFASKSPFYADKILKFWLVLNEEKFENAKVYDFKENSWTLRVGSIKLYLGWLVEEALEVLVEISKNAFVVSPEFNELFWTIWGFSF